jgi:hypothetical protein
MTVKPLVRAMSILRILFVVLVVLGATARANAADEPNQGEPAIEDLLRQGIALRRSGNDEAALAVFLDLEKRSPESVRLLLHIATAAQATGKWIMAYEYMQKADAHKDDPYYQRHRAAIENVEKTIAQRVGQFRARGVPAGAEVRMNGEVIGSLPMTGIKVVEVGSYVLEVYKPGYYPLRRPITVAGGGGLTQETVELRERSASLASAVPGQGGPDAASADTGTNNPQAWWKQRWVTWTLAGVGAAAAVTSGVAFGIRQQEAAKWNDDSQCLSSSTPDKPRGEICAETQHNIKVAENVAIATGITAVAFGGAALIHYLTTSSSSSRDRPADATPSGQAHAGCSPGLGSVVCFGTF